jgi:predicted aspartyl protease
VQVTIFLYNLKDMVDWLDCLGCARVLISVWGFLAFSFTFGLQLLTPVAASNTVPSACREEQVTRQPVLFESDIVLVTLSLNRAPVQFIVDTGTEWSTISQKIVGQLHLKVDPMRTLRTFGADSEALSPVVLVNSVKFGNVELRDRSFGVLDVPRVSETAADPVGVLGLNSLTGFDVSFDLKNNLMTMYSDCLGKSEPGWDKSIGIPLEKTRNEPSQLKVEVIVNSISIQAIIDTGAPITAINFPAARAAGVSIESARKGQKMFAVGIGGNKIECYLVRVGHLRVGPIVLSNVPLVVADFHLLGVEDDRQILLGIDFLKSYKFLISSRDGMIYMQ